ncbi:NAD(P)-dependent oxidoreductase [Anaeromyxobacter diazotrophicus]|uniref:D-glycerate dehydrogenase n=1 Tax=Anaeromyxobacter diazotrophicus TaxID=2590199 RepID=A0A7I9VLW9_9BACT|nr:NAD(P)-dependent oxidoreductase [Anaeromyxobacter diazotrophicus]GEJ57391.1 D-glycerate dehydrogenase [Anaeromyxobacter diazotrophicus]
MTAPARPLLYLVRALPGAELAPLRASFEVRGGEPHPPARDRLLAEAREAAALVVTYLDRVDAALLEALPRLRHVASYGVGLNHVDLAACRARGVVVTNTPDVVTDATADLTLALLLAAARRVAEGDRVVRAGGWTTVDPGWMLGTEVTGKTLGIVGFGRIGQAVARRAAGFSLRILYAAPREVAFPGAERVELDALLARSDFVSLNVPLTPGTENLLSRERLFAMKRGAILVNTARGAVVDEAALAEALASGHLAAAGLDVFRDEPRVPQALLARENAVLTPHLGSGTRETRAAMTRMVLADVLRVGRGEAPLHPVP